MGACDFSVVVKGSSSHAAFNVAVDEARYEYGHRGYTGTIAEKRGFVMISVPVGKDPRQYAEELMRKDDKRISRQVGPCRLRQA